MENYVTEQLCLFGQAAVLGTVCAAIYDILRAVRHGFGSRGLTHVVDALYAAVSLLLIFLFTLRRGEGELRLYMLLAMVLGGVFYFLLLSGCFFSVWMFWADALNAFFNLLGKPIALTWRCGKNFGLYLKKLFYFYRKYATIKK